MRYQCVDKELLTQNRFLGCNAGKSGIEFAHVIREKSGAYLEEAVEKPRF